ncbi:hypothetical protein SAMN05421504_1011366 [Amycolatopsis xylanica]|uniref:DUF7144 domain-containing protein n=1 Tax=Amycolatopsis xylanica TaxID=589385 RepID=A0A1H2VZS8_9PSEU|nr:hypothetical protein [Amycolatopsis xylanica]SDW73339.1 hypothetical protein SAMN05421504_1011366 [Amycolatopsis xylanica]
MRQQRHDRPGRVEDPVSEEWAAPPAPARSPMWAGWVWFAAVMMIIIGVFGVIEGLVAIFSESYYVAGPNNVLVLDVTGWGWFHLIAGILIGLTGIALFFDATWARVLTVVLAAVDAVAQLSFIAVAPVWSAIVIALCVMVIWAIVVHGSESRLEL